MPRYVVNLEEELKKPTSIHKQAFFSALMAYVATQRLLELSQAHMAAMLRLERVDSFLAILAQKERSHSHDNQQVAKVKIPPGLQQEKMVITLELANIRQEVAELQEKYNTLNQSRSALLANASQVQQAHRVAMLDALGTTLKAFSLEPKPGESAKSVELRKAAAAIAEKYGLAKIIEEIKKAKEQTPEYKTARMVAESHKQAGVIPSHEFCEEAVHTSPQMGGIGVYNTVIISLRKDTDCTVAEGNLVDKVYRLSELVERTFSSQHAENSHLKKEFLQNQQQMRNLVNDASKLAERLASQNLKLDHFAINVDMLRNLFGVDQFSEKSAELKGPSSTPLFGK